MVAFRFFPRLLISSHLISSHFISSHLFFSKTHIDACSKSNFSFGSTIIFILILRTVFLFLPLALVYFRMIQILGFCFLHLLIHRCRFRNSGTNCELPSFSINKLIGPSPSFSATKRPSSRTAVTLKFRA